MEQNRLLNNSLLQPGRTYLSSVTWPYDKYPGMQELNGRAVITLIDRDGPGVVSQIHSSIYFKKKEDLNVEDESDDSAKSLIVRVWYDREESPSIEMPWMEFLGDIQCGSSFFDTVFFSKVKYSHNFHLEMPFRKHIKIEIENTSDIDLIGYSDLQYDLLPSLPENCGYLLVDYRVGRNLVPNDILEVFKSESAGAIVAHWLQIEADNPFCAKGEGLCEANNEVYIDGEHHPSMEYLGTEDYYGYSWGFKGVQSNSYSAILKNETLPAGGSRIAMLRCREMDKIRFQKSCRIVMDYTEEYFSDIKTDQSVFPLERDGYPKVKFMADYRSCYYYYALKE